MPSPFQNGIRVDGQVAGHKQVVCVGQDLVTTARNGNVYIMQQLEQHHVFLDALQMADQDDDVHAASGQSVDLRLHCRHDGAHDDVAQAGDEGQRFGRGAHDADPGSLSNHDAAGGDSTRSLELT
jgi:hypothetical protein